MIIITAWVITPIVSTRGITVIPSISCCVIGGGVDIVVDEVVMIHVVIGGIIEVDAVASV